MALKSVIYSFKGPLKFNATEDASIPFTAGWALLMGLYTNSDGPAFDVLKTAEDETMQSKTFDAQLQPSLDWSSTIGEFLDSVKEQFDKLSNGNCSETGERESKTRSSESDSLLIFGSLQAATTSNLTSPKLGSHKLVVQFRGLETASAPVIGVSFNVDTYAEDHIARLLRQYEHIVHGLINGGRNMTLKAMNLLSSSEHSRLMEQNSRIPESLESCVHRLIEDRALSQPNRPAVVAHDASFSYKEVNDLSEKLAAHIISFGVCTEQSVVLCFEKSAWTAVAMLATLKTGGAIVFVDPSDSYERAKTVVVASQANIVLTSRALSTWAEGLAPALVTVDVTIADMPLPEQTNRVDVNPRNTAWIVFTSGSTGVPKGVVLEHAAICTSAEANGKIKHMDENSRVFAFSSYTFDGAIQDHLFPWIRGGCVCIPSEKERTDDLAGAMNRLDVNWTFLTPSVATLLSPNDIPGLKVLALGGEGLTTDNVRIWADQVTLQNAYGPAECTVACCVGEFKGGTDNAANVGPPLASLAWICNPCCHQQLVPAGCVGELLVEGPLLARGYLRDTETTARSFLDDIPWLPKGRRVYKTGDLVRQNPDGSLVYLGRKDDQVKLRGQRVSIADINNFLAQSELVRHPYTCVPKIGRFANSLVCVVSLSNLSCDAAPTPLHQLVGEQQAIARASLFSVQESMRSRFARYMVPTVWIPVQDLPLSSSGKIHGRSIRAWLEDDQQQKPTLDSYSHSNLSAQSPSSAAEVAIQQEWAEILGVPFDEIHTQSDFFGLGGNSLSAMILTSRLRKKGINLSAVDVMRLPKLENMARCAKSLHDGVAADGKGISWLERIDLDLAKIARECSVGPESIEDVLPATPLQEALLALTSRDAGAYIVYRRFQVGEDVDITRLRSAWQSCFQANPILRTRLIHDQRHGTIQVVVKDAMPLFQKSNDDTLDAGFGKPLCKVNVSGQDLCLAIHHSVYDGWSMPLILQDVEEAFEAGTPRSRPSFRGVVEYVSSMDLTEAETYWSKHLLHSSAIPYPHVSVSNYEPKCTGSIHSTIECHDRSGSTVTTATLAVAAWCLVQTTYTGMNDVSFGLITSGRMIPVDGVESIIGPLVGTTPFRTQIDSQQKLQAFLEGLQKDLAEMAPHVHYGLQRIQGLSPVMRTAGSFQNTFVVHPPEQDVQTSSVLLPQDVGEVNPNDYRTYPMHTSCNVTKKGAVQAKMRFDPAIISHEQTHHLMDYFGTILRRISIDDTETLVRDVLRSAAKHFQHGTLPSPQSVDICVHKQIQSNVEAQPDAPAISSWDASLVYSELESLSSRLAQQLTKLYDIKPETRVCFSFEKSSLPVVVMLAIMKAGGACVPLDISLPLERIRFIIERCQPAAVLCSRQQTAAFSGLQLPHIWTIDQQVLSDLPMISELVNEITQPTDSCYVLFTSGSTGTPKGCVWEHRTLSSSATAHGKALGIDKSSRVFQFSAFMWDISVLETITTLVHGGCICIPSEDDRLNDIIGSMNRMQVNWSWFTPSLARSLPLKTTTHLKTLVLGGEVIGQDNVDQYRDHFHLMTGYGPTECCIAVSVADFSAEPNLRSGNIGVGAGAVLWIVDPEDPNTLLPAGAPGEILIQGPSVGRGYLGDARKTAAVFLTDLAWCRAQGSNSNSRFYQTGDLGRMEPNGTITFIGRKDDQIKVNGQRLEIGEVEHQLLAVSGIRHAMVSLHHGRLTAVLAVGAVKVASSQNDSILKLVDDDAKIASIEAAAASRLPPFAVPSRWRLVEALPLTPARKLDRQRIRRWMEKDLSGSQHAGSQAKGVARLRLPTTMQQRVLHSAWSSVLHIDPENIGLESSFHQLGGDSITAIKLVALLQSKSISLTVADVFRKPVLAHMAKATVSISPRKNSQASSPFSLLPGDCDVKGAIQDTANQCNLSVEPIEDIYPATPLQEAILALEMISPGAYFAQVVYEAREDLDPTRLNGAWQIVAKQHTILRSRFVVSEALGTVQALVALDNPFRYVHELTLTAYLEQDRLDTIESGRPMARLAIVGRRSVVLTVHHAVYDGFTIPMIVGDLGRAYHQTSTIPRVPFRSFVEYLEGRDKSESTAFWSKYLDNLPQSDFPSLPSQSHEVKANASTTREISFGVSHKPGVTMATIADAAWALLLMSYTDSEDVSFGTTLAGRDVDLQDITSVPGPTLATVPMRYHTARKESVLKFLQEAQLSKLDVMKHQHYGLQHIGRLHDGAKAACEFRTVFVVFPPDSDQDLWLDFIPEKSTGDLDNFAMYPLTVLFRQRANGVQVTMNYDSSVVPEEFASQVMDRFVAIFSSILSAREESLVSDILGIGSANVAGMTSNRSVLDKSTDLGHPTVASPEPASNGTPKPKMAAPVTELERKLQQIWSRILNVDPERIGRDTSFFRFGDSIGAMQVVSACRAAGIGLSVQALLKSKTIAKLAELNLFNASAPAKPQEDDGGSAFSLSPIQSVYASLGGAQERWNQSMLLRARGRIDASKFQEALAALVQRNAMLRMRLIPDGDSGWRQIVVPATSTKDSVRTIETTCSSQGNVEGAIEQAQEMVDIQNGPVLVAAIIRTPSEDLLFLTAHHMAIDLVSWRVLLQDLQTLLRGTALELRESLSFQTWLRLQKQYAETVLPKLPPTMPVNLQDTWSAARADNRIETALHKSFVMDQPTTELLFGVCNQAFRTEPIDLLLAALWSALRRSFDNRTATTIFNETHGRETWASSVDISQTVGWFTSLQPITLGGVDDSIGLSGIVREMKEARRRLANHEWAAAFAHVVSGSCASDFLEQLPVDVVFNFGGSFQQFEAKDSMFDLVPEEEFRRGDHGLKLRRLGLLELEAMVLNGKLHFSVAYNKQIADCDGLLENLEHSLSEIATQLSQMGASFTPSDFPLLKIHDTQMQELKSNILPQAGVIDLANVEDIYPCQTLGDLLLLSQEYDPICHITIWTLKISTGSGQPPMDTDRMANAWRRVVERHTALRTVFVLLPTEDSRYKQVVLRTCHPIILQSESASGEAAIRVMEGNPCPFLGTHEPQHSLSIVTVPTTGEVYLKMDINHSFSDGASMGLLWRDLFDQYCGKPSKPAPPHIDFVDFFLKQPLAENDEWWAAYMKDATTTRIPTGDTGLEDAYVIVNASQDIDVELLHHICRKHDVSMPAVLFTAWTLLIAVFAKVDNPNFAYPGSGRDIDVDGIEHIVGAIISVMFFNIQLDPEESFMRLVGRVQADFHAHLERQFFRFNRLEPPTHEINNSSVSIQTMQSILPTEEDTGGIKVEHVHAIDNAAVEFLLSASYSPTEISLLLKYHRAKTTDTFAGRLAATLKQILVSIMECPTARYWPLLERLREGVVAGEF